MIPINDIKMEKEEIINILDALNNNDLSGIYGKYIRLFESSMSDQCDTRYSISTSSGTSALHLAMLGLDIKRGDEVIVPAMTMVATVLPLLYIGAKPVLVDIDKDTWCIDTNLIEDKITDKTKAIVPVHLYGNPCDMNPILDIGKKYGLSVIEDCAEALGAKYNNKPVGGLGDTGCHSFYSSKMITTGEGGMITTNLNSVSNLVLRLKNMAFGDKEKYLHTHIGYNYRLSNIQAALGLAQLKKLNKIINRKRELYNKYYEMLKDIEFQKETNNVLHVRWMNGVTTNKDIRRDLFKKGIMTGDVFTPLNHQPFIDNGNYPVSEELYKNGFLLPSSIWMDNNKQEYIIKCLKRVLK